MKAQKIKQKIKNQPFIQGVIGPSGGQSLGSLLREILMREQAEAARKEAEELGATIPTTPTAPAWGAPRI